MRLDVAVHGISFAQKHAPDSLLPKFREPHLGRGQYRDAALRASAAHPRTTATRPARPPTCTGPASPTGRSATSISGRSREGRATIVMPGNPQGRDINEAGPKSASLVTIDDGGGIAVEERLTSVAEFRRIPVDLSGAEDWRAALRRIEDDLAAERASGDERASRRPPDAARGDAARLAASKRRRPCSKRRRGGSAPTSDETWLDKIEIRCDEPRAAERVSADPIAELQTPHGRGGRPVEGVPRRDSRASPRSCAATCRPARARTCSATTPRPSPKP